MDWWGADVYVDFAWGDAPLTADASCTWVDETAYVRRVTTNRGRTSELSSVSPGTMSVSLDNSSRRFDPANTAGAHYGELLPMTKVRFRAGAGSTLVVFSGFVLGWPLSYPGMTDSVVQVQCVDGMRVLEQSETPGSAYAAAVLADSPDYYWPMQEVDAGLLTPIAIGGQELSLYSAELGSFEVSTSSTLPLGQAQSLQSGAGIASSTLSSALPALEAWVTAAGTAASGEVALLAQISSGTHFLAYVRDTMISLSYSDATANKRSVATTGIFTELPTSTFAEGTHHVVLVPSSTGVSIYVDGSLFASVATQAGTHSVTTANYVYVAIGGWDVANPTSSVSHFAAYTTAPSAARILAHYQAGTIAHGHPMGERTGDRIGRILDAIGWPTADRAISTGSTVCGTWEPDGGNALSQIRALESLEQGLFYIAADGKATFRDRNWLRVNSRAITARYTYGDGGGSEIPYGDIEIDGNHLEHVRNTVTVTYPGSSVTVKDATSRAAYGIQADSIDASVLPTWGGWLARQAGSYRMRTRKDPKTRIPSLVVDPRGAGVLSTTLPSVIDLDLGDRVTVVRRPNGSTDPISVNCHVQGIAHQVTPATWRTTLYLAPAVPSYTEGNNLLVGDATYGVVGAGHLSAY